MDEKELAYIYAQGMKDLVTFRRVFHPGPKEAAPAYFHYEWSDILLNGKRNFAIEAFRESAKALSLDTIIPTISGDKTIKDLLVGDIIFNESGKQCKVIKKSEVFYNHDCYKISLDNKEEIIADAGHRWYVYNKRIRKYKIMTTEEMFNEKKPYKHKNGYEERIFRIPLSGIIEYNEQNLPIHPYTLGVWLGDGDSSSTRISCHTDDVEHYIQNLDHQFKLNVTNTKTCKSIYLNGGFVTLLKNNNLIKNKHIPEIYFRSSYQQRLSLLQGLLDTDGTIAKSGTKKGTVTFINTNKNLSDGVYRLASSLGIKCTKLVKRAKLYGVDCGEAYCISFKTLLPVFALERKLKYLDIKQNKRSLNYTIINIEKIDSVPTQCIAVDSESHLFLCSSSYIVTHNTSYVDEEFPLYCMVYPKKDLSYMVFILSNQEKASGKLREISNIYFSDPLLCANLLKVNENSAKAFDVTVEDMNGSPINIRIEAYGKGSNIRGLKNRDRRPDIVIIDDPQDEEDSRSETVLKNDWDWFMSDVFFLGQYTRIFCIGNNLGDKCLMEMIINNHEEVNFDTRRIPILTEDENGNYISAWPERWTAEEIIQERENFALLGKVDIWFRNKMCIAMAPESQVFKREWFRYYKKDELEKKSMSIYTTCDLAISAKKEADRTWILTVGVTPENHWFVLDAQRGRFDAVTTMDKIFDTVVKWNPLKVGIEKVAYQAALEQFIIRDMPKRNIFFTIAELKAEGKKVERIKMLQPRFATGTIWFPENEEWVKDLEIELTGFGPEGTRGLHDDGPDALSYVTQIAVPPVRKNAVISNQVAGRM